VKRILIVDDDPVSAKLLELILQRSGYETAASADAAQALAFLESGPSIEMLICDQNLDGGLGGGMTGLEFVARLRVDPRYQGLPVILCTGVADKSLAEAAVDHGIRHFIVKPIQPNVVIAKVRAVAHERRVAMDGRSDLMARLGLSDLEYRSLAQASRSHLRQLRERMSAYRKAGDQVSAVKTAELLREPAELLNARALQTALTHLEETHTWHDFDHAVTLLIEEIDFLEEVLAAQSGPQLV
jgi:CheY-like chemotaxis protein